MSEHDELARHLDLARARAESARVFAFNDERKQSLPSELQVGDVWWDIVRADSELAMREALLTRREDRMLALVTRLRTSDLARDVRARIATHELLAFDPWESLLPAFSATRVDGRLRRNSVLGRALLRCATGAAFKPSTTGVLSADEAWGAYFLHALELADEPSEVEGWVRWFLQHPSQAASLLSGGEELREQVMNRAAERCGDAVQLVFRSATRAVEDGIDIGLRLHATAHGASAAFAAGAQDTDAVKFLTRLETYFGDAPLTEEALAVFVNEVLRTDAPNRDVAGALDALFEQNHAVNLAVYSDLSALGYAARRRAVGAGCERCLKGKLQPDELLGRLKGIESHRMFSGESTQHQERVRSLVRLTIRMSQAGQTKHPPGCADLALEYIDEQSFIDALREELEFGDLGQDLAAATKATLAAAYEYSTTRNQAFAQGLVSTIQHAPTAKGAFFTHEMFEHVLAPLAKRRAVLVIVVDGLSWFVLRRLSFDPAFERWVAAVPLRDGQTVPMFATLPSVTSLSRCSLLTGVLQNGDQNVEKRDFSSSQTLKSAMKNSHRAVLFHKKELDADGKGNVGSEVADAVLETRNRVVGVVINGVDAQLGGADQLAFDWRIDAVPPLRSLLELAAEAGRDVLIVSDHGHIWDSGTRKPEQGESARYREGNTADDGEVVARGPIVEAFGKGHLVLPYDEALRYTDGKRGYHGGCSLQEVVAPCVLLTSSELPDESAWRRLNLMRPAWWDFRAAETAVLTVETSAPAHNQQLSLIEQSESTVADWIQDLLASDGFEARRATYTPALEADRIAAVLATLEANGGRAHLNTLLEVIGLAPARVLRIIPALQRLLNLDGFVVLDFDRTEQMVRLDLALLQKQFHLPVVPLKGA